MPQYFFRAEDDIKPVDDGGVELADDTAAKKEVAHLAGALLIEAPAHLWEKPDCRINVTDADKRLVGTVIMTAVNAPKAD